MSELRVRTLALLIALPVGALAGACGGGRMAQELTGELQLETNRPVAAAPLAPPAEYTGTDPYVLEAQRNHRTALDLHRNVILRTCGPTGGVCHNQKEYPDLHTPANLLRALGAPCNIQPADHTAVFDGCERTGDRFSFDRGSAAEIGYVNYVPDTADLQEEGEGEAYETRPGLHISLQTSIRERDDDRDSFWGTGSFVRTFVNAAGEIEDLNYAHFQTEWRVYDGGRHLVGNVEEYQADTVTNLLAVGIEQGDRNRNGIFGAREGNPLPLLSPGFPEQSYLIGRLRGVIGDREIPGTRMPLANTPLSIADMLAVFCFVEGLPPDISGSVDMEAPIDYAGCSYSANPEALNLLGEGVSWRGRVKPLLETNCGGCHGGTAPQGNFDLLSEGAYVRLLGPAIQVPEQALITPFDPDNSYLFRKITGAEGIVGSVMPLDPLAGVRTLPEAAITDIRTWIENGALEED